MRSLSCFLIAALSAGWASSHGSLAACSASLMIALDHRLDRAVGEHDGAEHLVFGKLLGLGFDHHHGVAGAGDDEVETAFR